MKYLIALIILGFALEAGAYLSPGMDASATASNTPSAIVKRDSSGNFYANNISLAGGVILATSGTRPTCAVGIRGMLWVSPGALGITDTVAVCYKNVLNTYLWGNVSLL